MIYCELMGGLGNQLFQIFTTIAYALKHNHIFAFPNSKIFNRIDRPSYWTNFLSSLKDYTIDQLQPSSLNIKYNEKGFHYQEIPHFEKEKSIYITGYYQSYKYFEEYYDKICDLINLNEKKNNIFQKYPREYSNIISMHFRIGDYKKLQDFHPLLPCQYYKNSLQFILNKTNFPINNVLYFCESENNEEVLLMIQEINTMFPFLTFTKGEDYASDYEQMLMMSLCKHNIIANSSFSWFSAYFNNNENKIVCYPSIWFGINLKNNIIDDLCPKEWNKISI